MRDLLPAETRRQAMLTQRLMKCFELFGYQAVSLPAFEYAEVLERGLGTLDPAEVLRFVEPETGEVVALRPDMTPQVARLIATRMAKYPPPARLCYRGSVLRRRRERARKRRQLQQAGFELVGREGPAGDLEVLSVAAAAVRAAGLQDFVVDLGHARIAAALLERVPRAQRAELMEALDLKDAAALAHRAEALGLPRQEVRAISELPALHGGAEVWKLADRLMAGTAAEQPARELFDLWQAAGRLELAPRLIVDLGEPRNLNYYTGPIFQILAEGPGEWVGSGGRYDGLLDLFGVPWPSAGFAIDIDNLDWALRRTQGIAEPVRLVVADDVPDRLEVCAKLRALGVACVAAPGGDDHEYARAWEYSHVLSGGDGTPALIRVSDASIVPIPEKMPEQLAARIASQLSASMEPAAEDSSTGSA